MLKVQIFPSNITLISLVEPREPRDEKDFFIALDNLLENERFGLIIEILGEKVFSHEAKKQLGIWFKQNKEVFRSRCFGIARIKPSEIDGLSVKSLSLQRAMPCPYTVKPFFKSAQTWLIEQIS